MWEDEGGVLYDMRDERGRALTVHRLPGFASVSATAGRAVTLLDRLDEHCVIRFENAEVLG